jgi:hypothetical protein
VVEMLYFELDGPGSSPVDPCFFIFSLAHPKYSSWVRRCGRERGIGSLIRHAHDI